MASNYGPNVSNVLESKNRSFLGVIFQQKRPPLDSEWNLAQDILSNQHHELIRNLVPSGFLKIGDITTAPENRDSLTPSWKNTIKFKNSLAIVNGWLVNVGGGTNQFQQGAQQNIWEDLSNDEEEIAFISKDGPLSGYRQDLIFLEVFQKLIGPGDTIYKNGFVQSALPYLTNDLIDDNVGLETSRRTQIQYNIRYTTGVDFISYRNGLGFPGCFAKGASTLENTSYVFTKSSTDPGLYVAGDGSSLAKESLGTVDGYSYAIPVLRIHKRNRTAWSLTNQNGSRYSLTQGIISDRPDFLFYDEVNVKDMEDLRHLISFSGHDYESILEENLNLLWTKKLPSELKHSPLDENVAGAKVIDINGISTTVSSGIDNSGRVPNGQIRVFSEGRELQQLSYYKSNPNITGNQVIFTPIGFNLGTEEPLFDENTFYVSDEIPTVKTYDLTLKTITPILGGTWEGLGEFRTWNYTTGNRNKVIYTPPNITDVQNKEVIFTFKLAHREGGGLNKTSKGFNHPISKMIYAKSTSSNKIIDFNNYSEESSVVALTSPRNTEGYIDSAIARSISKFESTVVVGNEKYKASTLELKYYKQSTGSVEETIPTTLYERAVLGVLQVFNVTQQSYITPGQSKVTGGLKLTNLIVGTGDIVEYTVLLGNYTVDYVPHLKGIRNIAKPFELTGSAVALGETTGVINAKSLGSDGILATTGFFDGTSYRHVAFINNVLFYLSNVEGLGSSLIKWTLDPVIYPSGATLSGSFKIYGLGYYNPTTSDKLYFQYEYVPYAGIIGSRLNFGDTQQVEVIKADDKIVVTTAGTGAELQYLPKEYKGLTETLPINKKLIDFNMLGENVITSITGGNSSLRRIPGRWLATTSSAEPLKEGQILNIKIGATDKEMLRGAIIDTPKIIEHGLDFSTPLNHLTQWSAIVRGLGYYEGELFLLVITTVSAKYNSTEGPEYEYLTEIGTYATSAVGKGSETVLDNTLTGANLSQNLGNKIYGAVDIFPLKNRPLELSKSQ